MNARPEVLLGVPGLDMDLEQLHVVGDGVGLGGPLAPLELTVVGHAGHRRLDSKLQLRHL